MPWVKGQSGNKRGRPKQVLELVEYARERCEEAITTAVTLLRSEDEKVQLQAATFIRDTGMGRPSQAEFDLAQVSDEKLSAEVRRRAEIRAQKRIEEERAAAAPSGLGSVAEGAAAQQ